MKLDIIVNKYLLIWHLLYQSAVSEEIHNLKLKIWTSNKKEYSLVHTDKAEILNSLDDFIPDDDIIYNLVENSPLYKRIKIETNRYRNSILEIWDQSKKKYSKELTSILKFDVKKEYKICVVHPSLNVVETDFNSKIITIGKKITTRDKDNFLSYLMYKIIRYEMSKLKTDETEIVDVVTELAIINELYTRISKESKYDIGKKELRELKEKIYPYWLMYLGVPLEDFETYMVRDNIYFDKNAYKYEKILKTIDLYSFIGFIIRNKKTILKTKLIPVENIEML
ncbi:MAG: hypothetical protein IJL74_02835 [Bacilli bacterium]|nr:hypothetical protein [Bacilli bacterium]